MLPSIDLKQQLSNIDAAFRAETNNLKALLLAKLAILELGGWTEECIDKIVTDFVNARALTSKQKIINKLKKVYGFGYENDFRQMIVELVGAVGFERIESRLGSQCQHLETALSRLKEQRNQCAHTFTKPSSSIDAPSIAISLLATIETGLTAFDAELNKILLQP